MTGKNGIEQGTGGDGSKEFDSHRKPSSDSDDKTFLKPDPDSPSDAPKTFIKESSGKSHADSSSESSDTIIKNTDKQHPEETEVPALWNPGEVILDTYEVLADLGEGGFGAVQKVHHKGWNVDMAVKSAHPGVLEEDIVREAEVWMELGLHPNIVSCYYVRTLGGIPRMFVEYVEGGTLSEWLYGKDNKGGNETTASGGGREEGEKNEDGSVAAESKPRELTRKQRLAIAIEICRGMAHAHSFKWKDRNGTEHEGLVHRDLKPLNILMTENGTPRITDFGLVGLMKAAQAGPESPAQRERTDATLLKPSSESEGQLEGNGESLFINGIGAAGTPPYMAPEQWETRKAITRATDIYAFGVILYELFCNCRPFELPENLRNAIEPLKIAEYERIHKNEKPPDPKSLNPEIDDDLASLMQGCLNKKSEARPPSFADVRDALKAIYEKLESENYDERHPEPKAAELLADSLNNRACSYVEIGQPERAEELWKEALKIDPHHVESTYGLGLRQWGNVQITDLDLVRRLEEARASHGSDWMGEYALGLVHLERGDGEAALEVLEQAAGQAPKNPQVKEAVEQARAMGASCLRKFEGPWGNVTSVALSSDSRLALSVAWDHTLRLWEIETGQCLHIFEGHTWFVNSVAFASDNRFALSGGDKTLRLWDIETGQCLRIFEGHTEGVSFVAFTSDNRFALSGSLDHTLRLWEIETGECLRIFRGHEGRITFVAISSDGRFALSGAYDRTLRLWNLETGQCLRIFEGHQDWIESVAISSDERFALSGSKDKTLRLWNIMSGRCIRIFKGHTEAILSVAISSDGRFALSGSRDKMLRLWDIETGQCLRIFEGHTDHVTSVVFSSDNQRAFSVSEDTTLRLWDIETGQCLRTFEGHTDHISSVVFSSDSRLALSGSFDKTVRLWDLHTGSAQQKTILCRILPVAALADYESRGYALKSTAESEMASGNFAAAYDAVSEAMSIPGYSRDKELLDLRARIGLGGRIRTFVEGWRVRTFEGSAEVVQSVAISSDNRFALSGYGDFDRRRIDSLFGLRLWDIATGRCLCTFEGHTNSVFSVVFSSDNQLAFSGSDDKTLQLWDLAAGECLRIFKGHTDRIRSLSVTQNNRFVLSGAGDSNIRLWDIETGQCLRTFRGHKACVNSVALSSDGRFALSGAGDREIYGNTLRLWETQGAKCLRTVEGHKGGEVNSVAFSSDDRFALSGGGKVEDAIRLWDLATGECLRILKGHDGKVTSVAFSSDNHFAFSGSYDKTIRLWDLATGKCLRIFKGHTDQVNSISISQNNRFMLSGSSDKTLRLWEFVWDHKFPEPADWDEGARPYLETFLTLHTPYAAELPQDRDPTDQEIDLALTRQGKPSWAEEDFKKLLKQLSNCGYGWLRPDGVRNKLEEMASDWNGPPALPFAESRQDRHKDHQMQHKAEQERIRKAMEAHARAHAEHHDKMKDKQ